MPAMRTARLLLASTILLAVAAACGRPGSAPSDPGGVAAGETTRTLSFGGRDRSYVEYVPATLDATRPLPLVLVFHGGTGNAESAIRTTGFDAVADRMGFVVAYPNGTGPLPRDTLLTWNGGACCGYAQRHDVDDVGFARAIVADVEWRLTIDPARVYATGMSNGAILAQRLGCEAADLFAAIGPVAGTLNYSPCQPSRPVSVIEFHGTADTHIPYQGGYGPDSLVDVDFASVRSSVGFWASLDGCGSAPEAASSGGVRHETWTGCAAGTSVDLYTVVGGGHAWPGGQAGWSGSDRPSSSISATDLVAEFFLAHSRR
jgi:polyhydroxybutyrate depolymerase